MKDIHVRPGIVLIELFDVYLLISLKEARKHCPYMRQINGTAAFLWEMLRDSLSYQEILSAFKDKYEIDDPKMLEKDILMYIRQLEDKGYLLRSDTRG